ncbi:hypothetical protein ACFYXF_09160 [Streptomyces sp. NPDC002680]|uniref:hypothetical protein n=1 Tax=Streptomyces sp. NPDC002680 TaxID=3364659 RepID=UPI0036C1BC32
MTTALPRPAPAAVRLLDVPLVSYRVGVSVPADRSSIAYRRGLRDLGLSHFFSA